MWIGSDTGKQLTAAKEMELKRYTEFSQCQLRQLVIQVLRSR
jgi:hypothetical protein